MHVKLSCALALAAALAGCGGVKSASPVCLAPTCTTEPSLALAAEVTPATGAPFATEEFASLQIDDKGALRLDLDRTVTLTGVVHTGSGLASQPVQATLTATRPSRIAGRPEVFYQATTDANGAYQLVLSQNHPGESYSIRVTPQKSDIYPPEEFTAFATADKTLDLALDAPAELTQISGTVVDALSHPVVGVQVQALAPTTRDVVSTTVLSDDSGGFVVHLPHQVPVSSALLVVTPAKTEMAAAAPAMPTLATTIQLEAVPAGGTAQVSLAVPAMPSPIHVTYAVNGRGADGAEVPIAGAHLVFSTDVSQSGASARAIFRVEAQTGPDGNAEVDLIPASLGTRSYTVAVAPPAGSDFEATSTSVQVGLAGGFGAPIELSLRPRLSGRILDPTGKPVAGLTVQPAPAALATLEEASSLAAVPRLPSATTLADGTFTMRIDSGPYDLALIPPADTTLPRLWIGGAKVTGDTELADVTLPTGVMVHAQVVDGAGNRLAGADVRVYAVPAGNAACAAGDLDCLAPARLHAEGTTGDDGTVQLLLPSILR